MSNSEATYLKGQIASRYEVDAETGCWNWTGRRASKGHGLVNGANSHPMYAHKAAFIASGRKLPSRGYGLRHKCGNKLCVNPDHITLREYKTVTAKAITVESVYGSVCRQGHIARAVDVANELELDTDVATLEEIELLLEDPNHFAPTVRDGKKFYQAI